MAGEISLRSRARVCCSQVLHLRPLGLPRAPFLLALPTGSWPPLRPPEGRSPAGFRTSGLENCGSVNFCCRMPPSLWSACTAAKETHPWSHPLTHETAAGVWGGGKMRGVGREE